MTRRDYQPQTRFELRQQIYAAWQAKILYLISFEISLMQVMLVLIIVFIAAILVDAPLDHIKLLGSMGVYYGVDLENPVFAILDLFRPASVLDDIPF